MYSREAEPSSEDLDSFKRLWHELLIELLATGGEVLPTERSLQFYVSIFHAYTRKQVPGVVLFAESQYLSSPPQGVLMWGWKDSPVDTKFPMPALGWGTYIRTKYRDKFFAPAMRAEALIKLRELGFTHLLGSYHIENQRGTRSALAMGFYSYQVTGVLSLETPDVKNKATDPGRDQVS